MPVRPHPMTSGDELLVLLLDQVERIGGLLATILDRLPAFTAGEPVEVDSDEPADTAPWSPDPAERSELVSLSEPAPTPRTAKKTTPRKATPVRRSKEP